MAEQGCLMMRARLFGLFIASSICFIMAGCQSGPHAQQGTLLGGLTGGAMGALIGDRSDNALPGAMIGALAGGLAGNAVGGRVDQEIEASKVPPVSPSAVTIPDLISLSRSGLSEEVILNQVRANGFNGNLTSDTLIYLKNQGVSDRAISELQNRNKQVAYVAANPQPPIVIEREYLTPAPFYYAPPPPMFVPVRPCPPHRFHHHRQAGWGVTYTEHF
jgi:Glycine zipper